MAKAKIDGGPPLEFATTDEIVAELRRRWKGAMLIGLENPPIAKKRPSKNEPQVYMCHAGDAIRLLGMAELLRDHVIKARLKHLYTVRSAKADE